jgi:protein involved in ribonucleotide reduction
MQYDVNSVHLNTSGYAYVGRTRVKGMTVASTASGGTINMWDTLVAPVTATYGQSTTTVTVTKVAHGLVTGDKVGIVFAVDGSGVSATNGNYRITRLTADTFSINDINSRTITAPINCQYVAATGNTNGNSQWHYTLDVPAAVATVPVVIPGEGMLFENAIYITVSSTLSGVTIFYG